MHWRGAIRIAADVLMISWARIVFPCASPHFHVLSLTHLVEGTVREENLHTVLLKHWYIPRRQASQVEEDKRRQAQLVEAADEGGFLTERGITLYMLLLGRCKFARRKQFPSEVFFLAWATAFF